MHAYALPSYVHNQHGSNGLSKLTIQVFDVHALSLGMKESLIYKRICRNRVIRQGWTPAMCKVYRRLELVTVFYNKFASSAFTPFLLMYPCLGLILSLYGTFRTYAILPLLIYLICPLLAFVYFFVLMACVPQVGKICILSGRMLKCTGNVQHEDRFAVKLSRRLHRSLKPFGERVFSVGMVNLSSVLGILDFSFTGTVGLLGTF